MKMRFKQRWGLLSAVTSLSLVLAACGNTNTGTPAASGSGSAAPSTSASSASGGTSPSTSASSASSGSPSASGSGSATSGSPSSGASGSGAAAACPATAQGQQITMWSPLTGPDGNEMSTIAQQFNQENSSGITVNHVPQPEYLQKLNTAAAGGALPDMTVIRITDVPEMAERSIIKPMSDEAVNIVGGSSIAGEFPDQIWSRGEYDGQRYAIPLDVNPLVLYYNKELFQQAGITIPTDRPMNQQEFEAAAEALNKDGVAGVAIGTLFNGETMFDTVLNQYGGGASNEEGTEAAFNSEAGVRALTYVRDLKQKYSPSLSGQGDPEVKQFQQRRAGMVIHGPWHISDMVKLPFVGFAQVPQWGDEYAVQGGSHQLALTSEDPAKQAASACWIGWLSQNSVQWAKSGLIPVRQSAREGGQLESISPVVASFAGMADAVFLPPPVPGIATALGAEGLGRAVNPVLLGEQQDIKAALDQAAQRSNQLIQQNAQTYQ